MDGIFLDDDIQKDERMTVELCDYLNYANYANYILLCVSKIILQASWVLSNWLTG